MFPSVPGIKSSTVVRLGYRDLLRCDGRAAHWVQCASHLVEGAVAAGGTGTGSEEVAKSEPHRE